MQYDQKIPKEEISELVDRFYEQVRLDPEIGPVFNETVKDWPAHLRLLKGFWSTVLFTEHVYKGDPLSVHLKLPLKPLHFERWLSLFAETAHKVMSQEHAAMVIAKSQRIGENFQRAIAYHREMIAPPLAERTA